MPVTHLLAFDLGASSGRAILGSLANDRIVLKEIHRFENTMVYEEDHYHWDVMTLVSELKKGLWKCIEKEGITPQCIGIDTWGVDFGLLQTDGTLARKPFAYRDSITDTAMAEVFQRIPDEQLYAETGIQFMQFNSLFQLWALKKQYPDHLLSAGKILFMPDLLSYLLTGICYSEMTIASTSQMLDPKTRQWHMNLLQQLRLPTHLLEDLVEPGTIVGHILPEIQAEFGIGPVQVAAVAAHDTASAIAAVPACGSDWAYISSGTWSLMGVELDEPILTPDSFRFSFTNEGGIEGSTRFLKNITGMWLLQECKRIWDLDKAHDYASLAEMSKKAKGFRSLIDPDDPSFLNPENMIHSIQNYCEKTNQPKPETIPEITRCIFDSLALKYKYTLDQLLQITGKKINKMHLIGGGSQNQVLSQFTANALGMEVIAGPAEGTALGNLLLQAKAIGQVKNKEAIRSIVKRSVETKSYHPKQEAAWAKAYQRYKQIIE